eukprot:gnl/TRDRNA2_/TRDRNA2_132909_c1_seq2.p1 gnl/TRDRNA2_/TRDRNA2_132909_c1~~gnl/TRDRNA2_/TRDRNA2_132909_c1_seq2.p1  ORF type:complete len:113 (+),score=17.44 gnl/TRDRNA2_/TRDRNA2_132909_c1_seq2:382-720(+)
MSGHDHMMEHLVHDGVHMFVSGAGMECCYEPSKLHEVPAKSLQFMLSGKHGKGLHVGPQVRTAVEGGFASFEFHDEHVRAAFHSETGAELYVAPLIARRDRSMQESSAIIAV